jgi:cytochrome c oxidase cbb3-type subunit 4
MSLDINLARGVVLIMLILAFLGIFIWAWSRNRKEEFQEISKLPLEEDSGQIPQTDSRIERTKE